MQNLSSVSFMVPVSLLAVTLTSVGGASLMIIVLIGFSGSMGTIYSQGLDFSTMFPFILGSITGMLIGRTIA